jgi:hypothetical protein
MLESGPPLVREKSADRVYVGLAWGDYTKASQGKAGGKAEGKAGGKAGGNCGVWG